MKRNVRNVLKLAIDTEKLFDFSVTILYGTENISVEFACYPKWHLILSEGFIKEGINGNI